MDKKPKNRTAYGAGLPFTDAAQRAVEMANQERLRMGHNRLCGEHLFLGMAEGDCCQFGIDHAVIAARLRLFPPDP